MLYRIAFRDGAGRRLTLEGEKRVPGQTESRPWRDATTLYVRIVRDPCDGEPELAAAGVIELTLPAFLRELTAFRARPTPGSAAWAWERSGQGRGTHRRHSAAA